MTDEHTTSPNNDRIVYMMTIIIISLGNLCGIA